MNIQHHEYYIDWRGAVEKKSYFYYKLILIARTLILTLLICN